MQAGRQAGGVGLPLLLTRGQDVDRTWAGRGQHADSTWTARGQHVDSTWDMVVGCSAKIVFIIWTGRGQDVAGRGQHVDGTRTARGQHADSTWTVRGTW